MPDNNFELIDDIFCKLVDKREKQGQDALIPEEHIVLLIWHASGIIENGGFQYFFEQELDAETVACAYDKIGCLKCAELLRLAPTLFPPIIYKNSGERRIKYMEENSEQFEDLSRKFWKADKEMEPRLAEFVKKHLK